MTNLPPLMNRKCVKCKHHYEPTDFFAGCRLPQNYDRLQKAIRNPDGSLDEDKYTYYYLGEQNTLPCFEPKPKPPLSRLPAAIMIGLFLSALFSYGFLLVAHMPFAGIGYPPLPWIVVVIAVLVGCACGIGVATAWYRRES